MDSCLLAYAERPAPRYTSYPTAPHFNPGIRDPEIRAWLGEIDPTTALSLYIHVPYCRALCFYCGCNTNAVRRDEPISSFVDTLLEEIDLVSAAVAARQVTEVHWGGGTPNILSADQFRRIVAHLAHEFDIQPDAHHAMELDPRYLERESAQAYAQAGVNRLSFGVQDCNPRVQHAIGRVRPPDIVQRAVECARSAGIPEISMDLMYGLPHQGLEELRHSIRLAASMNPSRIALFGYAHVPWFKKRQRLIPEDALPGTALRVEQAGMARSELEALGYIAIGLDHFAAASDKLAVAARSGRLRRSFQGYVTQEAGAIIGLGPSAMSTLPQGYAQNAPDPGAWTRSIAAGKFATIRGHLSSPDDRARRKLIEQIMCNFAGDLAPLGGAAGCAPELRVLEPMLKQGLVSIADDHLLLDRQAWPLCRLVCMAFDAYAAHLDVARHSRAV